MTTNKPAPTTQAPPCAQNPDLFFGGHTEYQGQDRGGPSLEMKDRARQLSHAARSVCLHRCPLAQIRQCAQAALDGREAYGVWAGVQLPGGQTRKLPVLNAQRAILAGIADGSIDPYTHPSNADIMAADRVSVLTPRPPAHTIPMFPAPVTESA